MEKERKHFTIDQLKAQLKEWTAPLTINWEFQHQCHTTASGTKILRVQLYTDNHVYHICALTTDYLGCVLNCRRPLPGETHTRGCDLADGAFEYETWFRILNAILAKETIAAEVSSELNEN